MRWLVALVSLAVLAAPALLREFGTMVSTTPSKGPGWVSLFDGKTLDGWTTQGGPYDGKARWSVEDGVLVGRQGPNGEGGLLYTQAHYRNFEVELETWIDHPFDSGVFVRMVKGQKGAQVTLDYRPDGEIGGIYSGGWFWHCPHGMQYFGEGWNKVRVRCVGTPMALTTWINGTQVSTYTLPGSRENYAETGMIGLQVHPVAKRGEEMTRFRQVRVRPLDEHTQHFAGEDRLTLTAEGKGAGWEFVEWQGATEDAGYRIENDEIALLVTGTSPHLVSVEDYRDFHLRLDFMIAKMANSGLFLRAKRDDSNPAFSGCEIQILDDFNWETVTKSKLAPTQFTGSLYGATPPGHRAMNPLGQWNTYEIHYVGSRLQTVLNGKILYDVDTHALETNPPFAERAEQGFIGIQRHASDTVAGKEFAWFRNIFIRPDDSADAKED